VEAKNKELNNDIEALKAKLEAKVETDAMFELLNGQGKSDSELYAENEKLRQDNATLKEQAKERMDELLESYEKLDLFDEMEEKIAAMEKSKSSEALLQKALAAENEAKNAQLKSLKEELESMKIDNEDAITTLLEENENLVKENEALQQNKPDDSKLAGLRSQNEKLLKALKLMRQAGEARKKELTKLYDEIADMEDEEEKCMRAMEKYNIMEKDYNKVVDELKAMAKEKEALEKKLGIKSPKSTRQDDLLAELRKEIERMATDEIPKSVVESLLKKK